MSLIVFLTIEMLLFLQNQQIMKNMDLKDQYSSVLKFYTTKVIAGKHQENGQN